MKRSSLILLLAMLLPVSVKADAIRFRQHLPAYICTDYSTAPEWQKENMPYLKAQVSFAASVVREPFTVGPISVDPNLAFTWKAVNWPVGAYSSPIEENNYMPEIFFRINENNTGLFRGARVGWFHVSTGTDSISGSIDRFLLEGKLGYDTFIGERILTVDGYIRGWVVGSAGSTTAGISRYINFIGKNVIGENWSDKFWEVSGGELMLAADLEGVFRAVGTFGMTYQNYELYIPFAEAYDLSLFFQLWNGYADGLFNYSENKTSGGVGIALLR